MKWKTHLNINNSLRKKKGIKHFHQSIAFLISLAQIFGLMPIQGVGGSSDRSLHFTWKSWKIVYSFALVVGTTFATVAALKGAVEKGPKITLITAIVFYGSCTIVQVLFLRLARRWSQFMRTWYFVDVSMRTYGNLKNFDLRLRVMTSVVLVIAGIEHVLVLVSSFLRALNCKGKMYEAVEYYFTILAYPQVFSFVKYNLFSGILIQLINLMSTFSWTYIDLFIMLMSTSLALKFKQVTKRIESYVESKVSDVVLWRSVREDYCRLSRLCKTLNDELAYIVLVSFGSNLFFILVQFFNSLKKMEDTLDKIYFYFSFGFLIIRTVCVSLYGAWIHDESQKPLPLLNSVSSDVYSVEIRRFMLHMCYDTVALSGKRFFDVTRSLILSIAGTIVTYELVLIQFYGTDLQESKQQHNSTC